MKKPDATKRIAALKKMIDQKQEWMSKVPRLYRGTEQSLLPKDLLREVMAWKYGPTGLLIFGPSGTAKTRVLYERLKLLHFDEGLSWMNFGSEAGFGDVAARAYANGVGPDWTRSMIRKYRVVLFEDLAKEKLTDRVGEAFYHIIDGRTAALSPILAACNCTAEQLAERLGEDRGAAVVRRLREFCRTITVDADARVVSIHEPDEKIAETTRVLREEELGTLIEPSLQQMMDKLTEMEERQDPAPAAEINEEEFLKP